MHAVYCYIKRKKKKTKIHGARKWNIRVFKPRARARWVEFIGGAEVSIHLRSNSRVLSFPLSLSLCFASFIASLGSSRLSLSISFMRFIFASNRVWIEVKASIRFLADARLLLTSLLLVYSLASMFLRDFLLSSLFSFSPFRAPRFISIY